MAPSLNKNRINERRVQMRHTPKSFQPPLDHALANPKPLLNWTAVGSGFSFVLIPQAIRR